MMNLQTIDLAALTTVVGGEGPGPNQTKINGSLKVQTPGISVEGQGSYESSRTNYAACLDAMRGASPADIRATCGTPNGGQ